MKCQMLMTTAIEHVEMVQFQTIKQSLIGRCESSEMEASDASYIVQTMKSRSGEI